jgi:hypothetical protein
MRKRTAVNDKIHKMVQEEHQLQSGATIAMDTPQIHVLPVPRPTVSLRSSRASAQDRVLPNGIYTFAGVGDPNPDPWNTMFSSSVELLPSVLRRLSEIYGRPCAEFQKKISESVARANVGGLVLAPLNVLSHADMREIMNEYPNIQYARERHSDSVRKGYYIF